MANQVFKKGIESCRKNGLHSFTHPTEKMCNAIKRHKEESWNFLIPVIVHTMVFRMFRESFSANFCRGKNREQIGS
jgi:hypothetical protein